MRSSSAIAAGVVLLACVTAAPAARAGEEDAKSFFAEGRTLRQQNKCDEAIVRFRRALEVYPEGLGSLRNIAECEEETGKFAAARRDLWDLRRAVMQSSEAKYVGWDKWAEEHYNALSSKVGRIKVALTGVDLDRVKVVVDGKPFDNRLLGTELERDLGGHSVEGFYGGASPVTKHVDVGQGQLVDVVLDIPAPAPDKQKHLAPPRSNTVRNAGLVALGVGVVGLAGFGASAALRSGALSDVNAKCPDHTDCNPKDQKDLEDAKSRGKTASTMANVFAVVGGVGVVAGVTLVVVGSQKPKTEAAGDVRVHIAGTGASAEVRF